VESGAVASSLKGVVPEQFALPVLRGLAGAPDASKAAGCVVEGLILEEAQKYLRDYATATVPMAILTQKPIPGATSVRYQLMVFKGGPPKHPAHST
jgi:hypothetical protein